MYVSSFQRTWQYKFSPTLKRRWVMERHDFQHLIDFPSLLSHFAQGGSLSATLAPKVVLEVESMDTQAFAETFQNIQLN